MAAGDINDPLTNIPNVVLVDQTDPSAAPGAGYGRLEIVDGVLGLRLGTGDWIALVSLVAGLLTPLTEKVTLADTDLLLLQDEAAASALKKVQVSNLPGGGDGGGLYDAYLRYTHEETQNTGGGTATAGSWLTLPLTNERDDTQGIGALSANEVTLPAGTYRIQARHTFFCTGGSQIRLYDVTGAAVLLTGENIGAATSTSIMLQAELAGRFTLGAESAVRLEYYVTSTLATNGLGVPLNLGTERYGHIELWRETA